VFTQTGGMCAALEGTLEAGQHLLITDAEDSLSWIVTSNAAGASTGTSPIVSTAPNSASRY